MFLLMCANDVSVVVLSIETFSRNNFSHSFFCQRTGFLKAH